MLQHLRLSIIFIAACLAQAVMADGASKRVISIDGSITEIVFALGADSSLVGVDTTSRFPQAAQSLPNVGYMRALSSEGILSLAPDLVITTPDAGPLKVLNNLKQAGLNIIAVENERSIQGVANKVLQVAQALDMQDKGENLAQAITQQATSIARKIQAQPSRPKIMFLLAAGSHGVMISGEETQADAMIKILGGTNIVTEFTSYKPLTAEGVLQHNPDVIIIANNAKVPFDHSKFPALQLTKAYQDNKIFSEDSMLVLGFGPRIVDAIEALATKIYDLPNSIASK